MTDVTQILSQIEQGDPLAAKPLLPLVYDVIQHCESLPPHDWHKKSRDRRYKRRPRCMTPKFGSWMWKWLSTGTRVAISFQRLLKPWAAGTPLPLERSSSQARVRATSPSGEATRSSKATQNQMTYPEQLAHKNIFSNCYLLRRPALTP